MFIFPACISYFSGDFFLYQAVWSKLLLFLSSKPFQVNCVTCLYTFQKNSKSQIKNKRPQTRHWEATRKEWIPAKDVPSDSAICSLNHFYSTGNIKMNTCFPLMLSPPENTGTLQTARLNNAFLSWGSLKSLGRQQQQILRNSTAGWNKKAKQTASVAAIKYK